MLVCAVAEKLILKPINSSYHANYTKKVLQKERSFLAQKKRVDNNRQKKKQCAITITKVKYIIHFIKILYYMIWVFRNVILVDNLLPAKYEW